VSETELVPALAGSALSLSLLEVDAELAAGDADCDTLLYVITGSGTLTLADVAHELATGTAALVVAGEEARLGGRLSALRATVGPEADRHAALGPREAAVRLDEAASEDATGARSYQVLFGPANGSTRATLFAGHVPPGRAPWHFHLYDEIVWVLEGAARLHLEEGVEELGPGSAFRLRPRQAHVVENADADRGLTVLGVFTPAGCPASAYLVPAPR
jgi:quercetin dioxygenase-like cupin family protein